MQRELDRLGFLFRKMTTHVIMEYANELLRETDMTITEISNELGYSSHAILPGPIKSNEHNPEPVSPELVLQLSNGINRGVLMVIVDKFMHWREMGNRFKDQKL